MSKTLIQLAEVLAAKSMFTIFNVKQILPQFFCIVCMQTRWICIEILITFFLPVCRHTVHSFCSQKQNGSKKTQACSCSMARKQQHEQTQNDKERVKKVLQSATLYSLCFNGQTNQHFIVFGTLFLSLNHTAVKNNSITFGLRVKLFGRALCVRSFNVECKSYLYGKRYTKTQSQTLHSPGYLWLISQHETFLLPLTVELFFHRVEFCNRLARVMGKKWATKNLCKKKAKKQ